MKEKYTKINSKTIDRWVEAGWKWGKPIDIDTFRQAENGIWNVLLTPTKPMPHTWFPSVIAGLKILGLASGGAQQMPIFTALRANCTVLDYSKKQLESEITFAKSAGYKINTLYYDMTKPLPFEDESFDIIFHPVSNCYVEEVEGLFKECYRILKRGGIFVGGFDNGFNYVTNDEITISNKLPYNPLKNEEQMQTALASDDGIQFSHTLEAQIGGQLKAGFILTDIYEDTNGEGRLEELNIPTFLATRAIKK
ncbi:MAG: methyltransferase domain-containing protein [Bacilli bacterium]|nr:methyltransferase domain-containing protein [Bacilli bacterium]